MNDKKERVIADLRDMGIAMTDTVPVGTYNRMVRKRDEAVALAGTYLREIHDATHVQWCAANDWGDDNHPDDALPCDCWKAGL